jgi:hypothetical protein
MSWLQILTMSSTMERRKGIFSGVEIATTRL